MVFSKVLRRLFLRSLLLDIWFVFDENGLQGFLANLWVLESSVDLVLCDFYSFFEAAGAGFSIGFW